MRRRFFVWIKRIAFGSIGHFSSALVSPSPFYIFDMPGCFSDEPDSQAYPVPSNIYYPEKAVFTGFVGDTSSRSVVRSVAGQFRQISATVPSRGVAAPVWLVPDALRCDHKYLALYVVPGLMVTDTANFRCKDHYHKPIDTLEKLDFNKFVHVAEGISRVVQEFEN